MPGALDVASGFEDVERVPDITPGEVGDLVGEALRGNECASVAVCVTGEPDEDSHDRVSPDLPRALDVSRVRPSHEVMDLGHLIRPDRPRR